MLQRCVGDESAPGFPLNMPSKSEQLSCMQMSNVPPAVPQAMQPASANGSRLYKPPQMFSSAFENTPLSQQCSMEDGDGGAGGGEENGYVMEGFKEKDKGKAISE